MTWIRFLAVVFGHTGSLQPGMTTGPLAINEIGQLLLREDANHSVGLQRRPFGPQVMQSPDRTPWLIARQLSADVFERPIGPRSERGVQQGERLAGCVGLDPEPVVPPEVQDTLPRHELAWQEGRVLHASARRRGTAASCSVSSTEAG